MSLEQCRVVPVRPKIAGNLGATARVMRNLGMRDLVLVEPEADPADPHARQLSTHGQEILERARQVSSLAEAVADCLFVAGTSARTGGAVRKQSVSPPDQVASRVVEALVHGPAALVFGPEPSGLTNAEVTCCHYLIHIPVDSGYPALNLAQAVAICLYEVRCAWLARTQPARNPEPPASFALQDRMFGQFRQALEEIHYLYGPGGEALMHALRHLIGRAQPTLMEVEVLFGLARQIRWYVRTHGKTDAGAPPSENGP